MSCYAAALRILGYRFNSVAELRRKLQAKRFEPEVIEETIERLRGEKWLDDERFAGAFARSRARKKIGPRRIERELVAAGVDRHTARQAVTENAGDEREALIALCQKRSRLLIRRYGPEYLDTAEGRKKLAGYLLNQGYDAALVQSVVKELPVVDD
jgi:regulatory protein